MEFGMSTDTMLTDLFFKLSYYLPFIAFIIFQVKQLDKDFGCDLESKKPTRHGIDPQSDASHFLIVKPDEALTEIEQGQKLRVINGGKSEDSRYEEALFVPSSKAAVGGSSSANGRKKQRHLKIQR